jgi:hypothetical protein
VALSTAAREKKGGSDDTDTVTVEAGGAATCAGRTQGRHAWAGPGKKKGKWAGPNRIVKFFIYSNNF